VTKTADPTSIPAGTDGGTSTYTVTITNNNNTGSDVVQQVCDSQYGNIATDPNYKGAACAAGSACADKTQGTTCATNISCTVPTTLTNPGDKMTCTFTGAVPENQTAFTDTATATAVASNGATVTGSADATVTSGDASASAKFIKTLGSANPTQACVTVVYNAEVDNTSGNTTDEDETVTALTDDQYGDITTVHNGSSCPTGSSECTGSVTSTTCKAGSKILANGKCSVSGSACTSNSDCGATGGTCSGSYARTFNGVMCGTLSALTTNCAAGLELKDTLSGTLTGDETGETVSTTSGSRTVDVCLSATSN